MKVCSPSRAVTSSTIVRVAFSVNIFVALLEDIKFSRSTDLEILVDGSLVGSGGREGLGAGWDSVGLPP